jgi:hypothetical protein
MEYNNNLKTCYKCNLEYENNETWFRKNQLKCRKCCNKVCYKKEYFENYYEKNKDVMIENQHRNYIKVKNNLKAKREMIKFMKILL